MRCIFTYAYTFQDKPESVCNIIFPLGSFLDTRIARQRQCCSCFKFKFNWYRHLEPS